MGTGLLSLFEWKNRNALSKRHPNTIRENYLKKLHAGAGFDKTSPHLIKILFPGWTFQWTI